MNSISYGYSREKTHNNNKNNNNNKKPNVASISS